jgi:hypothetical protein
VGDCIEVLAILKKVFERAWTDLRCFGSLHCGVELPSKVKEAMRLAVLKGSCLVLVID